MVSNLKLEELEMFIKTYRVPDAFDGEASEGEGSRRKNVGAPKNGLPYSSSIIIIH